MTRKFKKKILLTLKVTFAVALLGIVVFNLARELAHVNVKQTLIMFGQLNRWWLIMLFVSGGASLIILSLYDVVLAKAMHMRITLWKAMRLGYIINAVNAVAGFGGFIGATVRYMAYKNETTNKKALVKAISVVLISMLTGLSLLSILVVAHVFDVSHLFSAYPWVRWLLYIVALFLPLFVIGSIIRPVNEQNKYLGVYCTIVSGFEWFAAALVLYFALFIVGVQLSFPVFMGVFIVAALSGLISFIPGGFGAFDLILLLGLQALNVPEEKIVLALLLYRFAYYFFPVLIALILSIFEFKDAAKRYFGESKVFIPVIDMTSLFKSYQKDIIAKIPVFSMSILLFFTSVLFFLNNLTIIIDGLYNANHYSDYIIVSVHTCACLLLMLNVVGVYKLSKRAIMVSAVALLLIMFVTLFTYFSLILIGWLTIMLILLLVFYRRARVLKRPFRLASFCWMLVVSSFVLYLNHVYIYESLYTLDVYQIQVDTSILRYYFWFTVLFVVLIVGTIVWYFERKVQLHHSGEDIKICENIIQEYGGSYLSHLIYTDDKQCFIDGSQRAFLMYRLKKGAYIVLGDPVGDENYFNALLVEFYSHAHDIGYDIIFYQVTDKHLALYHNFGNQFFKLGEEAVIDLDTFTVAGKKRRGLRATLNKLSEQGMSFEVVKPPYTQSLMVALQQISDDWLAGRKEMQFSVGAFYEYYLAQAPIAVIKNEQQQIIAFCNFMPTYYRDTISVDLIRWDPQEEMPLMDALYLHMLLWAKEAGYKRFNMGMATLSNVGQLPFSYTGERLAGRVFEHFNRIYHFQGLRRYKEKFKPQWESRFLVYRKKSSLWLSLLKVLNVIRR
ncbi:bifunctional lysylphosphatidylglycerol flippase/synthetase MprF [Staphylococcus arlettae]|uniref:bifunctional lysylphosphatidylglycerol flippase/synthetase MprF n=1 Tax=Staphylococcus arlettae TaxID=29378 RepID=UPI002DBCDEB2|nr:bifunctional lysylphosphatidylglycerol flippase/synthetase MprF [Staphylococcus arlettae]MEB6065473.1 bifunctional lysylphosphatidylglycerol flippase/synthetase MprF [Staphylococcus arlettae]